MNSNILLNALRENTRACSGKTALWDTETSVSYGQFWNRVDEMAASFREDGLGNGKITAVCIDNSIELAVIFFALLAINGSPLIINSENSKTIDLEEFNFHSLIVPSADETFAIRYTTSKKKITGEIAVLFSSNYNPAKKSRKLPGILVTSSGSTGKAKLIVLRMEGVLENITANSSSLKISDSDISLQVLPMSYSYGLIGQFLTHFFKGASIVLCKSKLSILLLSNYISKYKITTLFTVPPMLRQFLGLKHPDNHGETYKSLRLVTIGGNHVEEYTISKAIRLFDCEVVKTYGLAEAGPRVCTNYVTPGSPDINSAGRPIGNVAVHIVDSTGKKLGQGMKGKILVESPSVSAGYLKYYSNKISAGKKVLTKDYGYIDRGGNLVVLGRDRDFIYVNKRQLWFSEVESAIYNEGKVCKILTKRKSRGCVMQVLPLSNERVTGDEITEVLNRKFGTGINKLVNIELISVSQIRTLK